MDIKQKLNLLPCAYKSVFGFDCPICGFQRALLLFFKGNLLESLKTYLPLLPILFLILLFVLHLLNKQLMKREFLNYFSAIVLVIVAINYFFKLLYCF
jgi:hypothetical protein